jgi:hypothetical protein
LIVLSKSRKEAFNAEVASATLPTLSSLSPGSSIFPEFGLLEGINYSFKINTNYVGFESSINLFIKNFLTYMGILR